MSSRKPKENTVTFEATRSGRYGAIRGVSQARYDLDKNRQIHVTDADDIAGFDKSPAFERVAKSVSKAKQENEHSATDTKQTE